MRWDKNTRIQAFADDNHLAVTAKTEPELIANTNKAMEQFVSWARNEHLTINKDKTKVMYINRKKAPGNRTTVGPHLNGFKIGNTEIQTSEEITILGLTIHHTLKWHKHVQAQVAKVRRRFGMLNSMCARTWGTSPELLRLWYLTAVEKMLTYAAPIWGHKLDYRSERLLDTCQRQYILPATRAYRTTPTAALQVLTGIPPIKLKIKAEAAYGRIARLREKTTVFGRSFDPEDYEGKANVWLIHPAETLRTTNKEQHDQIEIYTDGSKTDNGTGAAFVAYDGEGELHKWNARLQDHNSVYQAEMAAIEEAIKWATARGINYRIHTDSQSSLKSLTKPFNKNETRDRIHRMLRNSNNTLNIAWVKAHIGITGNEAADVAAKAAAEDKNFRTFKYIKQPLSHLKREITKEMLKEWQIAWDTGNTGRKTHEFFPKVNLTRHISCGLLTQVYTEHGAIPKYLHRFKKSDTTMCTCSREGTMEHYLTQCQLTSANHLIQVTSQNRELWHKQLTENDHIKNKARKVVSWLMDNIDDIIAS